MSLINIIKIWRVQMMMLSIRLYIQLRIINIQTPSSYFTFLILKNNEQSTNNWAIDKLKHFFSFLCWKTLSRALLSRLPLPEFIFFHQVLMTSLSSFLKTRITSISIFVSLSCNSYFQIVGKTTIFVCFSLQQILVLVS